MPGFPKQALQLFILIVVMAFSADAIAQENVPNTIKYRITKICKTMIIDGKIKTIDKNGSDDPVFSNLEYEISGLKTDRPILEKIMNGKKHPKGMRKLVRIRATKNGNMFLRQDEPDIPYNDGFVALITVFPRQRLIIHSYQQESIASSIVAVQMIASY